MLHRKHSSELICITQPTHAWRDNLLVLGATIVSAPPLGRSMGAEQHDIGWHRWEAHQHLILQLAILTALPNFQQVSVDIWTRVKEVVTPLGRYPALLISLHGTGLFQRYTSWQRSTETIQLVERYLSQKRRSSTVNVLQSDPHYECYATQTALARNRQLVATWDTLSLMLCMGVHDRDSLSRYQHCRLRQIWY